MAWYPQEARDAHARYVAHCERKSVDPLGFDDWLVALKEAGLGNFDPPAREEHDL